MTTSSTDIGTDNGVDVVRFVTRLHKAAAAGRALLEAVLEDDHGVSDDVHSAARAALAAYDHLDAAQKAAT